MKISIRMAAARIGLIAWAIGGAIAQAAAAGQGMGYQGPCALAVAKDGKTLYAACADARQVVWVELPSGRILRRVDVPGEPTGLVLSPDGSKLVATCAAPKSTIAVFDPPTGRLLASLPAGHTAMGPAISPDGRRLYVCNRFNHDVSVIDLAAGRELARVKVVREPIAAAVTPDGQTVLVANHLPYERMDAYPISAVVTLIDARTHAAAAIRLAHGSHSVRGLALSPDGKRAYVTHLFSNFELIPTQVEMGWMTINVLSVLDVPQKKVLNTLGLDDLYEASANPWGVACTADGKTLCVSHAGTHEVSLIDAAAAAGELVRIYISGTVGAVPDDPRVGTNLRRRVKLPGKGPRGLAVAGSKLCVAEYFSDTVAVVDLAGPRDEVAGRVPVGPRPELSTRRRGELLFNDGTICRQQWQSCASCHPDGRSDALNWDLMNDGVGNPKNTKSMLLAFKTPPSMAEGVRPTAGESVRAGLNNILFAMRPEDEAVALDVYLQSLAPVPSPHLVDGRLSPAAERGKRLFESERTGCSRCHPAPLYTDLKMHDVGTKGKYEFADRFDTPTLIEAWRTAPYLHHGLCLTIKETLGKGPQGKSHGHVEGLSPQELDDLVEFVLSL